MPCWFQLWNGRYFIKNCQLLCPEHCSLAAKFAVRTCFEAQGLGGRGWRQLEHDIINYCYRFAHPAEALSSRVKYYAKLEAPSCFASRIPPRPPASRHKVSADAVGGNLSRTSRTSRTRRGRRNALSLDVTVPQYSILVALAHGIINYCYRFAHPATPTSMHTVSAEATGGYPDH